jgi:hypothetical protein
VYEDLIKRSKRCLGIRREGQKTIDIVEMQVIHGDLPSSCVRELEVMGFCGRRGCRAVRSLVLSATDSRTSSQRQRM